MSAGVQLRHRIWGVRTAVIRDNLRRYLTSHARGLVYILKEGIRFEFEIVSQVLPFDILDELVRDELRPEAQYGVVKVQPVRQWESSPEHSLPLLERTLGVPDRAELTRRLNLGMHGLTQAQFDAIVAELGEGRSIGEADL